MKLTEPQKRALLILKKFAPCGAGWLAKRLWPDSPGWHRMGGHGNHGRMGLCMPMNAGSLLRRMGDKGLCRQVGRWSNDSPNDYRWELTQAGHEAVAELEKTSS